jgi:hypothetical protein
MIALESAANIICRGLAWHTDETALRQKFEEFGAVEEAVSAPQVSFFKAQDTNHDV